MSSIDIIANPYKRDFPLLASMPDLAFLDSAATAQRPACVIEAVDHFYKTMNANPLRGLYELSIEATEAIENTRKLIARFIGVGEENARDIVFNRNASEALNIVAQSFGPTVVEGGDEICITIMEHHSNLIPWQQLCKKTGAKLVYMYCDKDGFISEEEMLTKIGPKTKNRRGGARLERPRRHQPHRPHGAARTRKRRIHGGRWRTVRTAHARRRHQAWL